jgi:hypothetical protein
MKLRGLEAVAYCEKKQVIELFHVNLEQAHDDGSPLLKENLKLSSES